VMLKLLVPLHRVKGRDDEGPAGAHAVDAARDWALLFAVLGVGAARAGELKSGLWSE